MEKAATGSYAVTLGVLDRSGKLIIFDSIQSMLRRPVNAASDVPVSFSMQKSGLYTSRVSLPFPGQWEVHAIMKSGKDQFHFVKRVIVQ